MLLLERSSSTSLGKLYCVGSVPEKACPATLRVCSSLSSCAADMTFSMDPARIETVFQCIQESWVGSVPGKACPAMFRVWSSLSSCAAAVTFSMDPAEMRQPFVQPRNLAEDERQTPGLAQLPLLLLQVHPQPWTVLLEAIGVIVRSIPAYALLATCHVQCTDPWPCSKTVHTDTCPHAEGAEMQGMYAEHPNM